MDMLLPRNFSNNHFFKGNSIFWINSQKIFNLHNYQDRTNEQIRHPIEHISSPAIIGTINKRTQKETKMLIGKGN